MKAKLMQTSRLVLTLGFCLTMVLMTGSEALACPTCKETLVSEGNMGLATGFYWSILFMMSMPFALITGFGGYMVLLSRRARREQANSVGNP